MLLIRESYLKRIRPYYDDEQIKILSGVRRCGKSTLMAQIVDEIKGMVSEDHIIFCNLEDIHYLPFYGNPIAFHDFIKQKMTDKKRYYVFLDEIQHIDHFENVLASLKATSNCSLFVTGSNSSLLSGNLASRLTGRVIDFFIMPFSFNESADYLASLGRKEVLSDYIQWGGIPLRFHFQGQKEIRDEINNLYLGIITRDILSSQGIRNERLFLQTATYVLSQSGNTVSPSSISGYLSAFDARIQKQTVYDYLSALEHAYLTTPVFRYDVSGKKALESLKKFYAIDPAFISLNKNGNTKESLGFALETVICNELLSRGYEIYTGRVKNQEIDFIIKKDGKQCYMQVAYRLLLQETEEREFGPLEKIPDNYPKYVLSLDEEDFSRNGIMHLNAEKFLRQGQELLL